MKTIRVDELKVGDVFGNGTAVARIERSETTVIVVERFPDGDEETNYFDPKDEVVIQERKAQ